MHKMLAIVLAGGEGARLRPLTATRCKPAVGFHGHHRVVDFVLSNLVNSGVPSVWVLVQHEPRPLIEHVARAWPVRATPEQPRLTVLEPQKQQAGCGFRGTADAVFQNIDRIEAEQPDVGLDLARDRERFTLTAGGLVAVPAGFFSRRALHPSAAADQRLRRRSASRSPSSSNRRRHAARPPRQDAPRSSPEVQAPPAFSGRAGGWWLLSFRSASEPSWPCPDASST